MPLKWFTCSDGNNTTIADCLQQCRMGERCLSRRTLRAIADQREWTGKPSTTQLLKGTREAYMELITPYAIDPQDALFRVHGSKAHAFLEQFTGANELGEERLTDDINSGQFDLYDGEEETLYDVKTAGSYKVMKALGYYQVDVLTGEVYKTGTRKGQRKTKKEWREGGKRDRYDWALQLNDYRIKLETIGFPVLHMAIEVLVRDGGLMVASMRGIEKNGVLITINRISDHRVKAYFAHKARMLLEALETGVIPPRCRPRERWKNNRKCQSYCVVREACLKELRNEGGKQNEVHCRQTG